MTGLNSFILAYYLAFKCPKFILLLTGRWFYCFPVWDLLSFTLSLNSSYRRYHFLILNIQQTARSVMDCNFLI